MSDQTRDIYLKEAELDFLQRGGDEAEQAMFEKSSLQHSSVETVVDFTGSKATPYKVPLFKQTVREAVECRADSFPGFRAYCDIFRKAQLQQALIVDDTAIPAAKKFKVKVPCCLAHKGLCETRDKWCMAAVKAATKSLFSYLSQHHVNSMFFLHTASGSSNYTSGQFFALCHTRWGGPKLNLVAPAVMSGDCGCSTVELTGADRGYDHCTVISMLGQVWLAAGEASAPDFVRIALVPHDARRRVTRGDQIFLDPNWLQLCRFAQVFPPVVQPRQQQEHFVDQRFAKSIKAVDRPPAARRCRKKGGVGVVLVAPGNDEGSVDGSEIDEGGDDESENSDADLPPVEEMGRALGDGASRLDRCVQWSLWSLSEVYAGGELVAWGANCNQHFSGSDCLACKKRFGPSRDGDFGVAKRLCKAWLLKGREIRAGATNARHDHVHGITREQLLIDLASEAEIDSRAEGFSLTS